MKRKKERWQDRYRGIFAIFLFFLSLLLLRLKIAQSISSDLSRSLLLAIFVGCFNDLFYSMPFFAASIVFAAVTWIPWYVLWIPCSAVIWLGLLANTFYFNYFGTFLSLATVRASHSNFWIVQRQVFSQIASPLIMLSTFALFVGYRLAIASWKMASTRKKKRTRRWMALQGACILVLLSVVNMSAPLALWLFNWKGLPIAVSPIRQWWDELYHGESYFVPVATSATPGFQNPAIILRSYSDYQEGHGKKRVAPKRSLASLESRWPLFRRFNQTSQETVALRKRLGLPEKGNVNVILVLYETARGYEFVHSYLRPRVFPQLNKWIASNGILFTQTYSTAVASSNGLFASECSMLPDFLTFGVIGSFPSVNVVCIPEFLRKHGVHTAWLHSVTAKTFGDGIFERRHGTEFVLDADYFSSKGIEPNPKGWGLADIPFLEAAKEEFENKIPSPFYAMVHTISSHLPYTTLPGGELPEELIEQTEYDSEYRGYLSGLKYGDRAIGQFLTGLFKGPLGDNTLVIVAGDHGTQLPTIFPHEPRRHEINNRILFALITKKMPSPSVIRRPIHQMDIAPTVAAIMGKEGEMTWLGHSIFSEVNTPWIYIENGQVSFRTLDHACYSEQGESQPRCWDVAGNKDPLFESLSELPVDAQEEEFFQQTMYASRQVIQLNLFRP